MQMQPKSMSGITWTSLFFVNIQSNMNGIFRDRKVPSMFWFVYSLLSFGFIFHSTKRSSHKAERWPTWQQGSWGQHGAQLGPAGPRWAPSWLHEPCYLGTDVDLTTIVIGCFSAIPYLSWRLELYGADGSRTFFSFSLEMQIRQNR